MVQIMVWGHATSGVAEREKATLHKPAQISQCQSPPCQVRKLVKHSKPIDYLTNREINTSLHKRGAPPVPKTVRGTLP